MARSNLPSRDPMGAITRADKPTTARILSKSKGVGAPGGSAPVTTAPDNTVRNVNIKVKNSARTGRPNEISKPVHNPAADERSISPTTLRRSKVAVYNAGSKVVRPPRKRVRIN